MIHAIRLAHSSWNPEKKAVYLWGRQLHQFIMTFFVNVHDYYDSLLCRIPGNFRGHEYDRVPVHPD